MVIVKYNKNTLKKGEKTMTSKLTDSLIDELVKNCKTAEDVLGDNGVVKEITKRLLERMLSAELTT